MKKIKLTALFLTAALTVTGVMSYTVKADAGDSGMENLALDKPVEGAPAYYTEPGQETRYVPEHAVDGDHSTLWGPVGKYPETADLIIDLEEARQYNLVKFYGRTNDTVSRTEEIVIYASDDKVEWTKAASKTCTDTNMSILFDEPVTSRYVKVQMAAKNGKDLPAMAEVEIYYQDPDAPQVLDKFQLSGYSYVDLEGSEPLEMSCVDEFGREIPNEDVDFTFESSDESVAVVSDEGVVTGVSKGEVTITVTAESGGVSRTAEKHMYSGYITPERKLGDDESPSEQQLDMMENRNYGLMMHFGINTFNDCQWSDGTLPVSSYDPDTIDAEQWARTAKEAGFTHIVIVSMHHDGFCMWDTQYTDYKCTNPESGNTTDVIKAVSEACEKYGIKLGLYYSLWNRHETFYNDDEVYVQHMKDQLSELLGGEYGEICEIWLDGAWDKGVEDWHLPELYDHIKSLQPDCQVGVNQTIGGSGGNTHPSDYQKYDEMHYFPSDFKTWDGQTIADYDETKIFAYEGQNYYLPYEETVCVRNPFGGFSWFWQPSYNDGDLYPVEEVAASMEKLHSRGNVFLLNMGIDDTGHMVEDDIATVYKAADYLGIASGAAEGAYDPASDAQKMELADLIEEYRAIDQTPYTKASVRDLMEQMDTVEEKMAEAEAAGEVYSADVTAWINMIRKAEDSLELIEGNENLALEKTVVEASPNAYSSGFVPENALDGDSTTLWGTRTTSDHTAYITIDLGSPLAFNEICMDGRASDTLNRAVSYDIYAGNDLNDLEKIVSEESCTAVKQTIQFDLVTARYVKVVVHTAGNDTPAYKEISVYNHDVQSAKDELRAYIEDHHLDELKAEDYTTDTYSMFKKALDAALTVLDKEDASYNAVKNAFEALEEAADALVPREDTEDPSDSVSKKTLEYFLNQAKGYVEDGSVSGLVESIQQLFTDAIAKGEAVMADEDATREEVLDAAKDLMFAIHALNMKAADKTDLEMALELTELIDLSKYVEAGQAEYLAAKEAAETVMADGDAMQAETDEAWSRLVEAMNALRLKADKSVLQDLISQMEGLDLSGYTEESVTVFRAALASANSIFIYETLSVDDQAKVDDALIALQAAYDGLEKEQTGEPENPGQDTDDPQNPGGDTDDPQTPDGDNQGGDQQAAGGNDSGAQGSTTAGTSQNPDKGAVKTGDSAPTAASGMILILSAGAVLLVMRKRVRG